MPTTRLFRQFAATIAFCLLAASCLPLDAKRTPPDVLTENAQAQTDAWIRSLAGLSPLEQGQKAEAVWGDTSKPQLLRDRAAFIVATRPSAQSLAAQHALSRAYESAAPGQKASMERTLLADLLTADDATLRLAGASVPRNQERTFPWSFIVWQAAQRNLLPDSQAAVERLALPELLADPSLLNQPLGQPGQGAGLAVTSGTAATPHSGRAAIILPMSGQFGSIGGQVAAGANVAVQDLAARGVKLDLIIIDTETPGWTAQVSSLPADCVVVGGPLRADSYSALRSAQALNGRALFAFLPQLPNPADEGTTVWRFFTSPQDQIDAVLNFAAQEQGVHSFGVLAPDDAFGQRMGALFTESAARRGLSSTTSTYPLGDMAAWTKITGSFVEAVATERGRIPQARASFEAVFLPDSWKSMDMLISAMHYHGANKKIMLGTALWEQALRSARGLNASTFALTVFPGVWNDRSPSPAAAQFKAGMAARNAQPGDWSVLGYDFVQLSAALGQDTPLTSASALNSLLPGVRLDWAGAPVRWDAQGKARRELFLFQPARDGMVPLDHEAFRRYRMSGGPLPNAAPGEAPGPENTIGSTPPPPSADVQSDLDALIHSVVGSPSAPVPAPTSAPAQ